MTDIYQEVFKRNQAWAASKIKEDPDYFKALTATHDPDFLFIGCSDSRVPASEITGLEPGEVFEHRNIANIVSNNDMNVHSVIQYAVEQLDVKHIVVCGHYGCGGIKAAMHPKKMGLLNGWLRNITDVYRMHFEELTAITDENERYNKLVELNVQEQCINVWKSSYLQKRILQKGYPHVHGWVYDMHNGLIKDLDMDHLPTLERYKEIFMLFAKNEDTTHQKN